MVEHILRNLNSDAFAHAMDRVESSAGALDGRKLYVTEKGFTALSDGEVASCQQRLYPLSQAMIEELSTLFDIRVSPALAVFASCADDEATLASLSIFDRVIKKASIVAEVEDARHYHSAISHEDAIQLLSNTPLACYLIHNLPEEGTFEVLLRSADGTITTHELYFSDDGIVSPELAANFESINEAVQELNDGRELPPMSEKESLRIRANIAEKQHKRTRSRLEKQGEEAYNNAVQAFETGEWSQGDLEKARMLQADCEQILLELQKDYQIYQHRPLLNVRDDVQRVLDSAVMYQQTVLGLQIADAIHWHPEVSRFQAEERLSTSDPPSYLVWKGKGEERCVLSIIRENGHIVHHPLSWKEAELIDEVSGATYSTFEKVIEAIAPKGATPVTPPIPTARPFYLQHLQSNSFDEEPEAAEPELPNCYLLQSEADTFVLIIREGSDSKQIPVAWNDKGLSALVDGKTIKASTIQSLAQQLNLPALQAPDWTTPQQLFHIRLLPAMLNSGEQICKASRQEYPKLDRSFFATSEGHFMELFHKARFRRADGTFIPGAPESGFVGKGGFKKVSKLRPQPGKRDFVKAVLKHSYDCIGQKDSELKEFSRAHFDNPHLCIGYYLTYTNSKGKLIRVFVVPFMSSDVKKLIETNKGTLPLETGLRAMRETAEGMLSMHQSGYSHLDLKPENVLVASDGRAHVTDFDTMKKFAPGEPLGKFRGSYGYAAPEVQEQPEKVFGPEGGELADVYSLGVFCKQFDMARPRGGQALWAKRQLEVLIERAMSRDPKDRPRLETFVEKLRQFEHLVDSGHQQPHRRI